MRYKLTAVALFFFACAFMVDLLQSVRANPSSDGFMSSVSKVGNKLYLKHGKLVDKILNEDQAVIVSYKLPIEPVLGIFQLSDCAALVTKRGRMVRVEFLDDIDHQTLLSSVEMYVLPSCAHFLSAGDHLVITDGREVHQVSSDQSKNQLLELKPRLPRLPAGDFACALKGQALAFGFNAGEGRGIVECVDIKSGNREIVSESNLEKFCGPIMSLPGHGFFVKQGDA